MSHPCNKPHSTLSGIACSLGSGHDGKHLAAVEWADAAVEHVAPLATPKGTEEPAPSPQGFLRRRPKE